MEKKYWVPALEKANYILHAVSEEPNKLRLIDLSAKLGIHKSSMFSLLQTMEAVNWVAKDKADTYMLGSAFGFLGNVYLRSNSLIQAFHREAAISKVKIGETIQLGRLEGKEVLYLAKEEMPSPVRIVSDPGMKFPAHATALGKTLLTDLTSEQLKELFPDEDLQRLTPHTLDEVSALFKVLKEVMQQGYALDEQESVIGFICVAAPVRNEAGGIIAAVSCSMPIHLWDQKKEIARQEIMGLAKQLSLR
jgi:DNA-binding IclR family transcriptional regulator